MRATALDLEGDPSRPNYEYARPDSENHWSDNWLALVQELWDDGNRQHSEPNSLDLALPFLQGVCDDLPMPSSVPTRNVGFGELDHYPTPEGEILQPDSHGGKCQSSQINCAHELTNPGKSICNLRPSVHRVSDCPHKLRSGSTIKLSPPKFPSSVCARRECEGMFCRHPLGHDDCTSAVSLWQGDREQDEVSEPNNHKRKYQGYPSNCPSDTSNTLRVSFTLPEFFVEIPETGTVSFLKIIDENKILSETGISHESRLDVILEPKPLQALVSPCPVSCYLPQLPCDIPPPLTRYSPAAAVVHQGTYDTSTDPLFCNSDKEIREDHEVAESQTDILVGKNGTSIDVIVSPAMNLEALDMGPIHQTINSFKIVQRRNSESFSVPEVETLVRGVEKLGTGRWKKIKEEAFWNARNRTHMDLKDKWRSLVKTANIPANKRRGAVIPEGILRRDTISPTFDQSETLANCPSVPPDPNPILDSLRLSGSLKLDSLDDYLKCITSMLMEENMEPNPYSLFAAQGKIHTVDNLAWISKITDKCQEDSSACSQPKTDIVQQRAPFREESVMFRGSKGGKFYMQQQKELVRTGGGGQRVFLAAEGLLDVVAQPATVMVLEQVVRPTEVVMVLKQSSTD
ncbi:telomeric repeat binding protein 1 [Actinidia rufa]|uniref:Telomeric repeat binding protein 1 n=1 Tax=Actinidia rufa TaxID=165716 RepID=A0A7J0DLL2_9ERIC|nr:telomeric repeat binding protein 1 [Actinidia rufa]